MSDLDTQRGELQTNIFDRDFVAQEDRGEDEAAKYIKGNYLNAKRLIENWWKAYEDWEKQDTFNVAVSERRMTMRSFGPEFSRQVSKTIPMNIADDKRFYANSARQKVPDAIAARRDFNQAVTSGLYAKPNRGIDSSAFAVPANFSSRAEKYKLGLHDISVKMLIPGSGWYTEARIAQPQSVGNPDNKGFKAQSHHSGTRETDKPHFSFLPVSKPEDQYVIYKLIQCAKKIGSDIPDFETLIRGYRSSMTLVKLSNHYDMGTGYIAIETKGPKDTLPYKVTYGIGNTTKRRAEEGGGLIGVTAEILKARKQAYFKHNANVMKIGNEVVIAMRKHRGPFPVLAFYDAGIFRCYDIKAGKPEPNGKTISAMGVASW
jgi:hypothetical protein